METLYKNLRKNVILRGHVFVFLHILFTVLPKIYCTLKIKVIETLTKFVLFSFLYLGNIRGTYSKYLENKISETDALFTAQLSTT